MGPPQSLGERLGVLPRAHFGMIPRAVVLEEHAGDAEVKVRGTWSLRSRRPFCRSK